MATNKRPYFQLFLLTMMLVVFPLVSYVYLKKGYDYRVASLDELDSKGDFSDHLDYMTNNRSVSILYFGAAKDDSTSIAIGNVHDAFKDQPFVKLLSLNEMKLADIPASKSEGLKQSPTAIAKFEEFSTLDSHCVNIPLYNRALILDSNAIVRRCYNLHDGQEVARLVEHITILVPKPVKEDIFFERKDEY